jgi:serine/threonine-protein kinase
METATRWLAADRYEVGQVIGRGGYGMVCRGFDRKTGSEVALKMLSPEAGRNADAVERMLREQQAMLALAGTCAVTAIDLFRLPSGAPCLVMEWLEGCDLEQQLAAWEEAGQLGSIDQLLTVVRPLALTLEHAHSMGIVHRDIKPANIFLVVGPTPSVRLLDFGLSRMKSAAPLTALGMVMGSPSYIAPETWRGNSALLDGRADFFALAVIVFRFLTGKLPFDVPDLIAKMTAVTSGPRPSVVALRADLPRNIDGWMSRALAVEPSDRFRTGTEFYEALAAALRGEAWPSPDAEAPTQHGVDESAPERKSALANAWQAAASLLKRFTGPRESLSSPPAPATSSAPTKPADEPAKPSNPPPKPSTPPPKPPLPPRSSPPDTTADDDVSAGDRKTLWLDSTELQDISSEAGEALEAPAPDVAAPSTEAQASEAPKPGVEKIKRPSKRKKRKARRKRKRK